MMIHMRMKLNKKLKFALATFGAFAVCGFSAYSLLNEPIETCAEDSLPGWITEIHSDEDVFGFTYSFTVSSWPFTSLPSLSNKEGDFYVEGEEVYSEFGSSVSDGVLTVSGGSEENDLSILEYFTSATYEISFAFSYNGVSYTLKNLGSSSIFVVDDYDEPYTNVYDIFISDFTPPQPYHITSGQRGLLSWSVDFDGEDYVGTYDFRLRFYPMGGDFDFDRSLENCLINFKGGIGGVTNATLKYFTSADEDTSFSYLYDDSLGWATLSMHSVQSVDPVDEESDVLWDWTTVVYSYHITLSFGAHTTPAYLDSYSPDNVLALYAVNDHATTYDLSLYAPFYGAGDDVVTDIVSVLTSGIVNLGRGIGQGVSSFVNALAFDNGSLSIYFVLVCVFGGIALAVGLTSKIFMWLSNLGS